MNNCRQSLIFCHLLKEETLNISEGLGLYYKDINYHQSRPSSHEYLMSEWRQYVEECG